MWGGWIGWVMGRKHKKGKGSSMIMILCAEGQMATWRLVGLGPTGLVRS